jgi:hypothetical protein
MPMRKLHGKRASASGRTLDPSSPPRRRGRPPKVAPTPEPIPQVTENHIMQKLADLTTFGPVPRPQRGIVYGVEGVGKTSLAVELPKPIIIDTEAGSHQFTCSRITVGDGQQLEAAIQAVMLEPNDYMTVVIDSLDWAERYILDKICKTKKVSDITDFPHGHGYTLLRDAFSKFLVDLNGFCRRGKHVVLIGHAQVKNIQLPGVGEPFDRWELKLDKRNSETVTEWADFQLFVNFDIRTAKSKDGTVRAISGHDRLIYPVHSAAYDAKNRLGMKDEMKMEYASIAPLFGDILTPDPPEARDTIPGSPGPTPETTPVPEGPNPDTNVTEPFLSDREMATVTVVLESLPQEKLLTFLRDLGKIGEGQDWHYLGPEYLRRILSDPVNFCEAVNS